MPGHDCYLLEMKDITKQFSGITVLDKVNFSLHQGEVHALLGENGAGKSTLMKILCGVYHADGGEILINNEIRHIKNPIDSIALGISIINQEMNPIKDLSVAENIFMGRFPVNKFNVLDRKETQRAAQKLLDNIQSNIKSTAYMNTLKISEMQLVEICKAISFDAKIIIMDEPTSALSEKEVETLFEIIRRLKEQGKTIIYISHKLDEIFQICDNVTILRDGRNIITLPIEKLNKNDMISYMVGRKIEDIFPKRQPDFGDVLFSVEDLQLVLDGPKVSFDLRKGEILGFAGLMGAGRTEIAEAIYGTRPRICGKFQIDGESIDLRNPIDAIKKGIAFVTDDRKRTGLINSMSVRDNITLLSLEKVLKYKLISYKKEASIAKKMIELLRIKISKQTTNIMNLSGGNQQKVVLAKWLYKEPKILILDEPTRGIDVGAKVEIYNIINDLTSHGYSIIFISSEMLEIIGVCDRVLVLHEGEITGELNRDEFSQEEIMKMATGN